MADDRGQTRVLLDQEGRERIFRYHMLEQPRGSYGVCVTEEGGESCRLWELTASRERAAAFLALLVGGGVGPAGLPDVAQEWLEQTQAPV